MRILRLHLQNVHALRNQWTIQFDQFPLYEAGLFAITGPTGGGKSSLLDAMIVALYGRVPRYGHNTPTELMTRHTAETLIELDFAVSRVASEHVGTYVEPVVKQQEEFSLPGMNSRIWKPTKPWTCAPVMFPRKSRNSQD